MNLRRFIHTVNLETIIITLFSSLCITCGFSGIKTAGEYMQTPTAPSIIEFSIIFVFIGCVLLYFSIITNNNYNPLSLLISAVFFSLICVGFNPSVYLLIVVCAILLIILTHYIEYYTKVFMKLLSNPKILLGLLAFTFISITLFTIISTISKYNSSQCGAWDLGIFSQMFYSMKEHFNMYTTCERNTLYSHLNVHISLIYYIILPIYIVIPRVETLLVIQAFILILGIHPLFKLSRQLGFSKKATSIILILYALAPATTGGFFFDFHENIFLIPTLLYMFYFFENNCYIKTTISALIVCTVKEDATIYVFVFSLFAIIGKRKYKIGITTMSLSIIYALIALFYLNTHGEGNAMLDYYFSNLIPQNMEGAKGLFISLITNPGYLITQLLDEDKFSFFIRVMLPLGCFSFATKKFSRYILIIPLIFFNLLPSYEYMHNIYFQYTFGSQVFLIYCAILNLKDFNKNNLSKSLTISVTLGIITYISVFSPHANNIKHYNQNIADIHKLDEAFQSIPESESVSASTLFVPKLSQRDKIYIYENNNKFAINNYDPPTYIMLDTRLLDETTITHKIKKCTNDNYDIIDKADGLYVILKKS